MITEIKVKENGQAKQLTPTEQWDQLAFQVIYRELAPKGFKKINSGAYRGQQIAACEGPGLPKIKVVAAQKIAAQLVRGFRERAQKSIEKDLADAKIDFDKARKDWNSCPWWKFKLKRKLRNKGEYFCALRDSYEAVIDRLNNTPIK